MTLSAWFLFLQGWFFSSRLFFIYVEILTFNCYIINAVELLCNLLLAIAGIIILFVKLSVFLKVY